MISNANFVVIGQDPSTKDFWLHEREDNNGKPGKIGLMADGKGDVRPTINAYVSKGYAPERIIYNGQPVTDVFTKTTDEEGNVAFKGANKGKVEKGNSPFVRQVVTLSNGEKLTIPTMMGSSTNVEPLDDGTYKVTTQYSIFPKPEPKVAILTEEELVARFKPNMNNKIEPQTVDLGK